MIAKLFNMLRKGYWCQRRICHMQSIGKGRNEVDDRTGVGRMIGLLRCFHHLKRREERGDC